MRHTITVFVVFVLCMIEPAFACDYSDPNALGEFMDLVNELHKQRTAK